MNETQRKIVSVALVTVGVFAIFWWFDLEAATLAAFVGAAWYVWRA